MPEVKFDPWALITAKENEKSELKARWDTDADLIDNVAYTMKDLDGNTEARVFHVTIPNASLFYAKIWALIASVSRLPTINSKILTDDEKAYITNFIQDDDYEIDKLLNNRGKQSAFATHAQNFCGRGWSVEQHLSRVGRDGKFLTDVRPLDPYGFTYASDIYGMKWGCIETLRSKEDIESQYNKTISGDNAIIKDFWNDEKEFIYLKENTDRKGEQIDERDNPYGYPPFIVKAVSFGPGGLGRRDGIRNTLKGKGESIFYPHRAMFAELNFMASMIKTQAYDDLRPGLQEAGDKGATMPKRYPVSKTAIARQNRLELVPTRGMTRSMLEYMRLIESIIQRSGLSAIDQGMLDFPLAAVALAKMMAIKESLTLPRLSAMAELYQARTWMIIDQAQRFGATVEIGQENMKRTYETEKLSGPYTISWKYLSESLEDIAAKAAIGNSMRGLLSDNDIRRDIIMRENPAADEDSLEVQDAKRTEPLIKLLERIFSLIDEDTEESQAEAWILHHRLTTELKQRVGQGIQPSEVAKQPSPTQQLAVFGRGGRPGGPQPVTKETQPVEGDVS